MRFLGTTPSSSYISEAFKSIFLQLNKIFKIESYVQPVFQKKDIKEKLLQYSDEIKNSFPNKKVIFILDSIDQLNTSDYDLDWLLETFPNNFRMIYSSLPDHYNMLDRIKTIKNIPDYNFLTINVLNIELTREILKDWFQISHRKISTHQWELIDNVLQDAVLFPLYLKLIFDIAKTWTSFYVPDKEFKKNLNIDKCIQYLFKNLELEHGKLIFSRFIVYLSSFRNGISESEIEDILSLDDEVLYEVFEFHAPPFRKLPMTLWSRIKHSLNEYFVIKEIDETRVITW